MRRVFVRLMERFQRKFTLKKKLIGISVLIVLMILVSDVGIFISFADALMEKTIESNKKTMEMIRLDIESQIGGLSDMADNLRKEESILEYVDSHFDSMSVAEKDRINKTVTQKLFDTVVNGSLVVTNCCLIRNDSEFIIQNPYSRMLINDKFIALALAEIGTRQSARIITVPMEGINFYCLYLPVYPRSSGDPGKMLFVLNERMFGNIFSKYRAAGHEFICTDISGNYIYHSTYYEPTYQANLVEVTNSSDVVVSRRDGWLMMSSRILNMPFCIQLRIPYDVVFKDMESTVHLVIVFIICITLLLTLFCIFSMRGLYNRVREVNETMNHVSSGDFKYRYASKQHDEISEIGYNINDMVDKLNALIIETTQKELAAKKAQFRAVQMQINPHFLYNTLETIRMVALYHNDPQAARITKDLSDLFRYTISSSSPIVSIGDELNYILKYIEIQKNRAKDKFSLEVDVDSIVLDYTILRLILQPLVENAIYHGIEGSHERTTLRISGRMDGKRIFLEVADTGVGMPPDRLAQLRGRLERALPLTQEDDHIGLCNVNERLRLYFGVERPMQIESVPGKGTTVSLQLPAVRYKGELSIDDLTPASEEP